MVARILIIEPEADDALELKIAFEEEGCLVEVARNGVEGLAKGISFQPDVVITEVMMKPLSGFEVTSRIAAGEGFRAPVIFYSSFYRDEKARQEVVLKYGAAHYFFKPYQVEALKKTIMDILGQVGETAESSRPVSMPQPSPQEEGIGPSSHSAGSWSGSLPESGTSQDTRALSFPVESFLQKAQNRQTRLAREDTTTIEPDMEEAVAAAPNEKTQFSHETDVPVSSMQTTPLQEYEFARTKAKVDSSRAFDGFAFSGEKPSSSKTSLAITGAVLVLSGVLFYVYYLSTLRTVTQPTSSAEQPSTLSSQSAGQPSGQTSKEEITQKQEPASVASTAPTGSSEGEAAPLMDRLLVTSRPEANEERKENEVKAGDRENTQGSSIERNSPPAILISDVSGREPMISLVRSKRPQVTPEILRASGDKALVVRVVVDRLGKVVDAKPLNLEPRTEAMNKAVMSTIRDWEFSRYQGQDNTANKYFSFKVLSFSEGTSDR